ncbi:MFS transporter [Phytomonospora endophytica]|uniref:MFS family permease n=1 Tax=Phytomonospora endophytica TaxID=714109 RepID=A0A841FG95_9ACTN|nr:MFS transporter [Phytomonospora endophytica]MBB6035276.1 MFS family permease [Phytomonospora endophytica]GIG63975.1 MFS transporter [Phytomonospora endophytica]
MFRSRWWPLAAIVLAVFMLMLDATVVTVALPAMGDELDTGLGGLQWVLTSYALTMGLLQLPTGMLADRVGHRRMFYAGVALFTAASLACGLAPGIATLVGGRIVQGFAAAILFASTMSLVALTYEGRDRGIAFGVRGMTAGVAVVCGPLVGGALVSGASWRWIFFLNVPVAALCVLIAARTLPRTPHTTTTGTGFASFLRPRFVGAQTGAFVVQAGSFALFMYISVYFQDVRGYTAIGAGLALLPGVVPLLLAGPVAGSLIHRVSPRPLVVGGLGAVTVALTWMFFTGEGSGWWALVPGMALSGFGAGVVLPVLGTLTVDGPGRLGLAAGINNTVQQLGGGIGIATYGAVLGTGDFSLGLHRSYLLAAAVTAVGAAVAYGTLTRVR